MIGVKSGIIAAIAFLVVGAGAVSAAPLGGQTMAVTGSDSMIVRVDYDCRHLRHECREAEERGYGGEACHRYHEECGHEHCERLRHACHEERERGDGEEACHRLHEECEER